MRWFITSLVPPMRSNSSLDSRHSPLMLTSTLQSTISVPNESMSDFSVYPKPVVTATRRLEVPTATCVLSMRDRAHAMHSRGSSGAPPITDSTTWRNRCCAVEYFRFRVRCKRCAERLAALLKKSASFASAAPPSAAPSWLSHARCDAMAPSHASALELAFDQVLVAGFFDFWTHW